MSHLVVMPLQSYGFIVSYCIDIQTIHLFMRRKSFVSYIRTVVKTIVVQWTVRLMSLSIYLSICDVWPYKLT